MAKRRLFSLCRRPTSDKPAKSYWPKLKTVNIVQQMHAADPKTEREIRAFIRAYEESFNANEAAALAALCTEDAIQLGPEGPIRGRQAIEKKYVDLFRQSHPGNIRCTIDQVSVLSNVSWNSGAWSCTLRGENGPVQASGYRLDVLVREAMLGRSAYRATTWLQNRPRRSDFSCLTSGSSKSPGYLPASIRRKVC